MDTTSQTEPHEEGCREMWFAAFSIVAPSN
jgi:hypothetical protein